RGVLPPDPTHIAVVHLHDVRAVEPERARDDLARRHRDETHERERSHGLAAAGLTDYAERFARRDLERHTIDRADDTVAREELRVKVRDLQKLLSHPVSP